MSSFINSNPSGIFSNSYDEYEEKELTYKILQANSWKNIYYAPYDFNKKGFKLKHGSTHLLYNYIRNIRLSLNELGFSEVDSRIAIETDAKSHNKLNEGSKYCISDDSLNEKSFRIKVSKFDYTNKTLKKSLFFELLDVVARRNSFPTQVFMIDKVFQNTETGVNNLQEFHAVEVIFAGYELDLGNILGITSELFSRLNIREVEYKPSLHYCTSPAFAACLYNDYLDNLISVAECGIAYPEICEHFSIPKNIAIIRVVLNVEKLLLCIKEACEIAEIINPKIIEDS